MLDTPRPDHNHPLDSLCLVIACPRGAYDAGKAAHIDTLTKQRDEFQDAYEAEQATNRALLAHLDALTAADRWWAERYVESLKSGPSGLLASTQMNKRARVVLEEPDDA